MVKKCFVVHEEVIDVFNEKYYILTIEKIRLVLLLSGFVVQWNVRRLEIICFLDKASNVYIKFKKDYAENSAKQPV